MCSSPVHRCEVRPAPLLSTTSGTTTITTSAFDTDCAVFVVASNVAGARTSEGGLEVCLSRKRFGPRVLDQLDDPLADIGTHDVEAHSRR